MRHPALATLLMGGSLLILAACGSSDETAETETPADAAVETADTPAETGETLADAGSAERDLTGLADVVAGDWRTEGAARDAYRHPVETLEFLEVDPTGTIVEIWPGAGWYTNVLAPWVHANGGTYIAAHFPENETGDSRDRAQARFAERFSDTSLYGEIEMVGFDSNVGLQIEPGTVDTVLTFRNVHNWMSRNYAEGAFSEFYDALRPGGTLGVVEHRLPSTREQDPNGGTGYVQEAYVIALAEEAGFELVGSSEINANPRDTADHPFGVWTLPPVRRSPSEDEEGYDTFDREAYDQIGESDRMTLLFRKPEAGEMPAEDAETETDGE